MTTLQLRFLSDPASADWHLPLEAQLSALTQAAGLDEMAAISLQFAAVEAINNVLEHAYGGEVGRPIELLGDADPTRVCLTLRDQGGPMPLPLPDGRPAPAGAESGRGWQIIRAAFPDVRYERVDGTNELTLIRPLAERGAD